MKKISPVLIPFIVVVIILGAWFLFSRSKGIDMNTGSSDQNQAASQGAQKQEDGSITGRLKDIINQNVPLKCTWSDGQGNSGTAYIKNRKYYTEIKNTEGKDGFMIMLGSCLWSWQSDNNQGIKMCFSEEESQSMWDETADEANGAVRTPTGDYRCAPDVFSDVVFSPPSNINFVDFDQMMQDAGLPDIQEVVEEEPIE